MTHIRRDPFGRIVTFQDRINRLFDDSMARSETFDEELSACAWHPAVDVYETAEGVVLEAELPGISKEDVLIELKNNILIIKGERREEKHSNEDSYYRQERCFGSFHRTFALREDVDPAKITAKFNNGILKVEIPRPEQELPKKIKIDVTE